jgi:hypothetical protein
MAKCSLKVISDKGKVLHGAPAQEVFIKRQGGWDAYHEKMVVNISKKVYKEIMKEQQRGLFKIAK